MTYTREQEQVSLKLVIAHSTATAEALGGLMPHEAVLAGDVFAAVIAQRDAVIAQRDAAEASLWHERWLKERYKKHLRDVGDAYDPERYEPEAAL